MEGERRCIGILEEGVTITLDVRDQRVYLEGTGFNLASRLS